MTSTPLLFGGTARESGTRPGALQSSGQKSSGNDGTLGNVGKVRLGSGKLPIDGGAGSPGKSSSSVGSVGNAGNDGKVAAGSVIPKEGANGIPGSPGKPGRPGAIGNGGRASAGTAKPNVGGDGSEQLR